MKKQKHHMDIPNHIPGGIHLCQVNERVSCGACCGLYNMKDISKQSLWDILLERSDKFDRTPREMDAILIFGDESYDKISANILYSDFHHCPYVGLIGDNRFRIGCLLHPLSSGNNGIDFRGLSFYGGMACHTYFCPSHELLSPLIKNIVRNTAADWYVYGLMITEITILQFIFEHVQRNTQPPLILDELVNRHAFLSILREFLELKIDWPHRPPSHPSPCNYFFNDRMYSKPEVGYPNTNTQPSRHHKLFKELISRFDSQHDLHQAESLIDHLIERLITSIAAG